MAKKTFSFSEAVSEIDRLINQIEDGKLDIDKMSDQVKRVSGLIIDCQKKLRATEEEINNLFKEGV